MRKLLLCCLLIISINAACQTSSTQVELTSKAVQINSDLSSIPKAVLDVLEDSSGNTYELGRAFDDAKSFIRKLDSSGTEVWTQFYDGIYVATRSNALISSESKIAICTSGKYYSLQYLEIDVSTGIISRRRYSPGIFMNTNINSDNTVYGIAPSKNYMYVSIIDGPDSSTVKLLRHDLNNPDSSFHLSKYALGVTDFFALDHIALSDTNVIITGLTKETNDYDSVSLLSMTWAATPTVEWGIQIKTNLQTRNTAIRTIPYSDNSKLVSIMRTPNKDLLVIVVDSSDGSIISKSRIGGFPNFPRLYDAHLANDATLYITTSDGNSDPSIFFVYDLTTFTGKAYNTNSQYIFFYGLSGMLSNGHFKLSRCDGNSFTYTMFQFHPDHNELISEFLNEINVFTFPQQIIKPEHWKSEISWKF